MTLRTPLRFLITNRTPLLFAEVGIRGTSRYARTIGGNESDSVGMKEVALDRDGLIAKPDGLYISVVQIDL
jgi:hypothetical protein